MLIIEHAPAQEELLDFINDSVRQLHEAGVEARYILIGTEAYRRFRMAMANRFNREPISFELYNYLPLVLDPFRTDTVCVIPGPGTCADGVETYRVEP